MTIKRPSKLLFANTVARRATSAPMARTRKTRPRATGQAHKIGIFDISARAGLLFDLLDEINRRQKALTFYPVETSVPMGVGIIGPSWLEESADDINNDTSTLDQNVAFEEYLPFLREVRKAVDVDMIAGLFGPMLAYKREVEGKDQLDFSWNLFSVGSGAEIGVSVFGVREYALSASRPFEAAVALLTLAEVWAVLYGIKFHPETRGCVFDECENRDDLVGVIRNVELCPDSLAAIPSEERGNVERCLQLIRSYAR